MTPQPPRQPPIRRLTVLSDSSCPLCRRLRHWLEWQKQLVPLEFVEAGSPEAWARFPQLDHRRTGEEITVVGDSGQVFEGPAAWIACLWALADHRATAHRLSTPAGAPLARAVVLAAAKSRKALKNRTQGGRGTGPVVATARGAAAATGPGPGAGPGSGPGAGPGAGPGVGPGPGPVSVSAASATPLTPPTPESPPYAAARAALADLAAGRGRKPTVYGVHERNASCSEECRTWAG